MFYRASENLLNRTLSIASEDSVEKLDAYLASLAVGQAHQISPWRVSQKTNIPQEAVLEIFLLLAKEGLLRVKYEVWDPNSRVKILETFDRESLKNPIQDETGSEFVPSESDIQLSFCLNEVQEQSAQKKKSYHRGPATFKFYSNDASIGECHLS